MSMCLFVLFMNMKLIRNLVSNVLICSWLLFLFAYYEFWIKISIQGVSMSQWNFSVESIASVLIMFGVLGFLFWVINTPVKKILSILTIPVNVVTLGLFSLILNVLVFYLFQYLANTYIVGVHVDLGEFGVRQDFLRILILSLAMSIGITVLNKIL